MVRRGELRALLLAVSAVSGSKQPKTKEFVNQWAVHIPGPPALADSIATEYVIT
jgi:hypothetical protein